MDVPIFFVWAWGFSDCLTNNKLQHYSRHCSPRPSVKELAGNASVPAFDLFGFFLCKCQLRNLQSGTSKWLAWLPLQSLAVKKTFFCAMLGGEKLLTFVEKCR